MKFICWDEGDADEENAFVFASADVASIPLYPIATPQHCISCASWIVLSLQPNEASEKKIQHV